jgi:DNA-binding transcriptional LysR family regulator
VTYHRYLSAAFLGCNTAYRLPHLASYAHAKTIKRRRKVPSCYIPSHCLLLNEVPAVSPYTWDLQLSAATGIWFAQCSMKGWGNGRPPFFVQRDIEDGRLVRVLPEWRTAHLHPLWTVRPHGSLCQPEFRLSLIWPKRSSVLRSLAEHCSLTKRRA